MFTNNQIQIDTLPKIEFVEFTSISKNYLKILIINNFLFSALILTVYSLGYFLIKLKHPELEFSQFWLLFLLMIGISILSLIATILGFYKRKYAIRENDIIYTKGVLYYKLTTIPFVRIQHIEVSRSFIARKFNLATLSVFTAGNSGSDLVIKGLDFEVAEKLNVFISSKINA